MPERVTDVTVDLTQPLRVHVVGVGGTGMSAIAEVLVGMGHRVTGTDQRDSDTLTRLRRIGVEAWVGHRGGAAAAADLVTASTAVPAADPDVAEARGAGVPVASRADVLRAICACRRTIAVAGTHGKTTTASMVATVLEGAGRDPSWVVGAELRATGSGGRWGAGEWLVVEADESDGTFLRLPVEVAVLTSVEPDHLDFWGDAAALARGFEQFLAGAPARVACADDEGAAAAGRAAGATTYGTAAAADWRIAGLATGRSSSRFTVEAGGARAEVVVGLPGAHNARNATAALAAAAQAGVPLPEGAAALAGFGGVARRFESRGEWGGATFVDDYAHLPSEVAGALGAAAGGEWDRIVCVFQPHRYSRTQALWRDFADSFGPADVLVVTELYPAGEPARPGVGGKLVLDAVAASPARPRRLLWLPDRAALVGWLRRELRPGDLCLTLGAGDLTTVPDEVGARAGGEAG